MIRSLDSLAIWLGDFYLLSTHLLAIALATGVAVRQPAKRLAVIKATLVALGILAALCALPRYSLVHLRTAEQPDSTLSVNPQAAAFAAPPNLNENTNWPTNINTAPLPPMNPVSDATTAWAALREIGWQHILVASYSAGAVGVFGWLVAGQLAAIRLRRQAQPAPAELIAMLDEVATRSRVSPRLGFNEHEKPTEDISHSSATAPLKASFEGTGPHVQLLLSARIAAPVALGIRQPTIILPKSWQSQLPLPDREGPGEGSAALSTHDSAAHLHSILAHELAHIRNHDLAWLAVSRTLLVLLWAQPLYWLLRRRMRFDQETLADAAAAEITNRQQYAEQLVAWARNIGGRPAMRLSAAVGLWEGPSQLRQRVTLLVDEQFTILRYCSQKWQRAAAVASLAVTLALSSVTLEPATRAASPPANRTTATSPTFRALAIDLYTGKPVAGIRLSGLKRVDPEGISNADGLITIDNMPKGKFDFVVSAVGEPPGSDVAGLYARWQSPDAVDEHQRKDEFDGAGFQRNFDYLTFNILGNSVPVKLLLERGVTINGRVIDPDGNPVGGATVAPAKTGANNSITGDTRYSFRSNQDGSFQMRLPASGKSKYNLVAHDGDYKEWRRWANGVGNVLQTQPGQVVSDVVLQLTHPCTVRGKVIDANGKPIAHHEVRTESADMLENRYYYPTTRTNERGEFELQFVRPGKHFAQADPFWLIAGNTPQPASQPFSASPDQPVEGIILSPTPMPKNKFGIPNVIIADRTEMKRPPALLSYGDGKPDGKKSYGGNGHMIRFELPEGVTKGKGIRIHGSRYGLPQAPDEDFEITFLSEKRDEVLHTESAPYKLFKRGKENWVRMQFKEEVELPPKFWIALDFNAEQTKGVYVSYDTSTKGEYSRVGKAGDEKEPQETDFAGDWMVQVMLGGAK